MQSIVESKDTLKNEEGAEIIDPETSKPLFVADRCSGSHLQSWEPTGGRTGEEAELDYASENRPEGEWPGWGKLKSLKERCQQLSMRFKDSLPAMESDFESRACGCLGCCDDHAKLCPFPVVDTAPNDGSAFDVAAKP